MKGIAPLLIVVLLAVVTVGTTAGIYYATNNIDPIGILSQPIIIKPLAYSVYTDGGSVALGQVAASPTEILKVTTTLPAGNNLIIAPIQVQSSDTLPEYVVAGALALRSPFTTTLSTNAFIIPCLTAGTGGNYFLLANHTTSANEVYNITAYSNAIVVNTEAKIAVLSDITYSNYTDGASTAIATTDTSLATVIMPGPAGNNVIIAVIQIDNTVAQDIVAGAIKIKNGVTTLTSNEYEVGMTAAPPSDLRYMTLLAYDTGAAANSIYNVSILGPKTANAEAKVMVFRVVDAYFTDSGSTAIATSATSLGTLQTYAPAGSDVVTIAALQVNDTDTLVETLAATTGFVLKENETGRSNNQLIFGAMVAAGTAVSDGFAHALLWRTADSPNNAFYNVTATASADGLYGEIKILSMVINKPPTYSANTTSTATPMTYYPKNNIGFQMTCTDDDMYNGVFETGGTNYTMTNTTATVFTYNLTDKAVGTITYKMYCNDTAQRSNSTDSLSFIISKNSTIYPQITNFSPSNTTYNTNSFWANVTTTPNSTTDHTDTSWCGVSMNNTDNLTMTNSSGNWNLNITEIADGSHNITFYCNNTDENYTINMNQTEVYNFTILLPDSTFPQITIQIPENTTYCSGGNFAWNITTDSPGYAGEWCGVSLNGGANSTMTNATGNWYADSLSISSGNYNSKFCCNNTENTETCVDINYTVLNIPTITIQLPANTTYCNNTLWFNATLNYDVSSCSYSIDNLDNDTLTNSTGNWNDYRDMDFDYCDHNVTFYCNQSTCTATSYSEANPIYTTPIRRFWSCYVGGGTSNEDGALLILPFLLALIMGFLYIKLRDLVKYMDILFSGLALVFVMIGITMLAGYGGDATLTSMLTDYKIILIWLFVGMMFALLLYAVYQAFQMWKPKSFKDNYEK